MMELCQRAFNGKGMSDKWRTSMLVLISKGKEHLRNCNAYWGVKRLEHAMNIVEREQERRIRELVNVDVTQFVGIMPNRETTDATSVVISINARAM